MSEAPVSSLSTRINYNNPQDRLETLVCETIKTLGILTGIGLTPLWGSSSWLIGVLVGLGMILLGLSFVVRGALGRLKTQNSALPAANLLQAAGKTKTEQFLQRLQQLWKELFNPSQRLILLPLLVILIGIFLFIPGLSSGVIHELQMENSDLVELYFSAPAILVWIVGELAFVFPRLIARPKHMADFTGIARSILQVFSAILLWVFLALAIGNFELSLLLWLAVGLALTGLILGFISEAADHKRHG